jgi:hypothetical protein
MKKIFTLLVLMGSITSGFAQWKNDNNRAQGNNDRNNGQYNTNYKNSALVINAFTRKNITIVIDNNLQYQANGNALNLGALNPGMHNIVIYQWRSNFWGKQKREIIYSNALFLKPNVETALTINSYGRVDISERALYSNNNFGYDKDRRHDDDRDHRWNHDSRDNGRY